MNVTAQAYKMFCRLCPYGKKKLICSKTKESRLAKCNKVATRLKHTLFVDLPPEIIGSSDRRLGDYLDGN